MRIRDGAAARQTEDAHHQAQLVSGLVGGQYKDGMTIADGLLDRNQRDCEDCEDCEVSGWGLAGRMNLSCRGHGRVYESAGRRKGRIRGARTKKKEEPAVGAGLSWEEKEGRRKAARGGKIGRAHV